MVKIEIDGKQIEARDGDMVIEAADAAGIYIPRFCYHKKLSIAANCRMCLVEVEKARKPLPACSTPVTDGMKVATKSKNALAAQKGVMEFLLINHPLDCPICDQGGECELQDIAVGYGNDVSRYSEGKRVVADKNLGPLISTDMTRCIHCTRCVRFGDEIAGVKELGATGRGEHMQIGTYIEHAVESEVSGNVIDLCPVGALTSKPFRFSARAWEMQQRDGIAAHDCLGSNIHSHVRNGKVTRVAPMENEQVNETWISDRDRFSYEGYTSEDRAEHPMVKEKGVWKQVDWQTALDKAFTGINKALNDSADKVGFLGSPTSTSEELYLMQKLARSQGVNNIDHRLRQQDFLIQDQYPTFRSLGQNLSDLDSLNAALIVGSNIRKEQPIAGLKIRKAALNGGKITFINSKANEFRFPVLANIAVSPAETVTQLASILAAVKGAKVDGAVKKLMAKVSPSVEHKAIAESLSGGESSTIVLGSDAINSPNASEIEVVASALAAATHSTLGYLTDGANSSGASIIGALPHRTIGGKASNSAGLNCKQMFENDLAAYVLMNIEPEFDCADPVQSVEALKNAECVISLTPYVTEGLKSYADVILPIATAAETAGTFVNIAGNWQSFNGTVPPVGEARPAWKVLRVLGNLFEADGFDFMSVEDILDEVEAQSKELDSESKVYSLAAIEIPGPSEGLIRVGGVATHSSDNVVRRASSLQATKDALPDQVVGVSENTAKSLNISDGDQIVVQQGDVCVTTTVRIDKGLAERCVSIPSGTPLSAQLGAQAASVTIEKSANAEQNAEEIVRASNA